MKIAIFILFILSSISVTSDNEEYVNILKIINKLCLLIALILYAIYIL